MAVSNTGKRTAGPNRKQLPGKSGSGGGRVVGARNSFRGAGRKLSPTAPNNAGGGADGGAE